MALTRCGGIGGRPDTGSTRSGEVSSDPPDWESIATSCGWAAGTFDMPRSLGCINQSGAVTGSLDRVPSAPVGGDRQGYWG